MEANMRHLILPAGALALLFAASPASAMMCGGGQQAQSSGNTVTTGMMCGGTAQAADDPMADKPAQTQRQSGMCPCCRNMAMRGGMGGTGGGMQHNMPGMETPKN
jgi:hypothetical protein